MTKKTKRSSRARMSDRRANRYASAALANQHQENLSAHYSNRFTALQAAMIAGHIARPSK